MRERRECHCMLFLTENNEFASDKQEIRATTLGSYLSQD